jgi:bifunctional N-acetylglucosamine-1-phosphate-uridyltransferase/glucosamine-1-phosphate-acetyltransferase GlmU-like protein
MAQMPILIILAGGASSRMWPLREKSLLRFGTESLLIGQLQRYRALGFQEAIIVTNPENQADITKLTAQMSSMNIRLVVQPEAKGMGDALLRAETALSGRSNAPIYINQVHDVVEDKLHLDLLANYIKLSGRCADGGVFPRRLPDRGCQWTHQRYGGKTCAG